MPDGPNQPRVLTAAAPLEDAAYRALLDAMPGLVFTTDQGGAVEYVNERFADYAGTGIDDLREGGWERIVHPDDHAASAAAWTRAMAARASGEVEHRVRARDGRYRWFLTRMEPLTGAGGLTGWLGFATDIDEKKTAEEYRHALSGLVDGVVGAVVAERISPAAAGVAIEQSIRDAELRYRTLFDSIDEGYCLCELIVDAEGRPADYRFLEVNPHFAEMTGIQPDAIGRTARELVPGLEDWWVETYGRVALTGEPARFEHGSEVMGRVFDVYVTPVPPQDDLRFAIVFRDITARRRTEREEQLLHNVGDALQSTLDRDVQLHALVTIPVPDLVDMAAVYMRDADGVIRRLKLEIPAGSETAGEYPVPQDRGAIAHAFMTGESFFVEQATDDILRDLATSPEHLEVLRSVGVASLAYVPMFAHGQIVGVYGVGTRGDRVMDAHTYAVVDEIARRAGLALDNAELLAETRRLSSAAQEASSTLNAILEHAPVGVVFLDPEGRYQHVNPALAAMNGIPVKDHLGRHVSELVPQLWPKVEGVFDRIRGGEDEITFTLNGTTAATGSSERTWEETWYAVRQGGDLRGIAAIIEDITERLRSERQQAVRVAISELKNQALDDEAVARGALGTLAPALSDWAAIYVVCDDGGVERTAFKIGDTAPHDIERGTLSSVAEVPDVSRRAMMSGDVTIITEITDAVLRANARDDAHLDEMRAASFVSGLTIPMYARGRIIGAISLATSTASGRRFDETDVAFAREAAGRIGVAIENARLHRNLAASEERHRRLIEASPSMVFETAVDGAVVWASPAYWEYTGLDPEHLDSYDWERRNVVHPDDQAELQRRWQRSLATGEPYENELRLRGVDGSYRWFLNRLVAQRAADGTITGWVGTGTDIHDRVIAETRMAGALDSEQEARVLLDAILQAAPVALTVIDRNLRWIHINETAARFNGFSVEEHLAARVPDLLPDVWSDVEASYNTIFETGEPLLGVELELPTPGTSDEVRSWSASYFPVSRDGRVFAVAAMYSDVTDRRRAEQERERLLEDVQQANAETQEAFISERNARALLDTVLSNAPVAVFVFDAEFRFVHLNEQAAALNGMPAEEQIGRLAADVIPDDWPRMEPTYRQVLDSGMAIVNQEFGSPTPAHPDQMTWWLASIYPLPVAGEKAAGVVGIFTDITDTKEREIEREHLVAELQRANAAKDEFLGLVSHELKTPITTIYGNAQVLQNRSDQLSDADRAGSVADIAYESERLHRIIDNLLVLARLDRGAAINTEPVLVGRIAQRIAREHEQRFPTRPITVLEDERDGFVLAEPVYIEQVMRNLVSNAEKYSPPGAPIEIQIAHRNGAIDVAVCDRGAGFSEQEAAQMFSPFYRAPTSAKVASGIGIGLAVCKRLVEAQDGEVWARPREGGGADIGFSLPLAEE